MYRARSLYLLAALISLASVIWMPVPGEEAALSAECPTNEPNQRQDLLVPSPGPDQPPATQEVHLPTDGPGLVEFLRRLSPSDVPPERIEQLITQLGSPQFAQRDRASKDLVAVGISALPGLRQALKSSDGEVVRRAQACIRDIIPPEAVQGQLLDAVRGLIRLRPAGAVETLLRYLPNANEETLEEEIWYGLDTLTKSEGRIDAALVAALKNVMPVRRAAAACIVGRRGNQDQRIEVRKLLTDTEPMVRLRAAQGLLAGKDKTVIPVLIALLDQRSVALVWQAEELLHWVAGEDAPEPTIGSGSAEQRERCRKSWEGWWLQHGEKVDLVKLDEEPRRPVLLLMRPDISNPEGRVWLCGCDGKPRWQITNLSETRDVHLLPCDRLLVAQGQSLRVVRNPTPHIEKSVVLGVTERDLEGKILWQYKGVNEPLACRRLPNGNTLIYRGDSVEEVTPEGKHVFYRSFHDRGRSPAPEYLSILCNGHLLYRQDVGDDLGSFAEVDAISGRELKKVALRDKLHSRAQIEPLPNEHHLIIAPRDGRVLEVDGTGQTVWQYSLNVEHATRLRSGDTLICCRQGWGNRAVAIDPTGKMVWEVSVGSGVTSRCQVCLGLVRLGFDSPYPPDLDLATSIPYRLKSLKSIDATVRRLSVYALAELDPKGITVVPALIDALNDPAQIVRKEARQALVQVIGPKTKPHLLEAARDKRPNVRASATWLLWKFSGEGKAVVPVLLEALHDENALVRREAAAVIWKFAPENEQIVQALVKVLKDNAVAEDGIEMSVAQIAASSLGSLGAQARDAVPALIETSKSPDRATAYAAIWALGNIGANDQALVPVIVSALIEVLNDKKRVALRSITASALSRIGPGAETAVPDLLRALKVQNVADAVTAKRIRASVLSALGQIGPGAKDAIPQLTAILQDRNLSESERKDAAEALGNMGEAARNAASALRNCVNDNEEHRVRDAATRALQKIQR